MPKYSRRLDPTPVSTEPVPAGQLDANTLLPGPKLRQILGISPVTLWRWRHDKSMRFPTAKSIQGRLYFPWKDVSAWLAAQQEAA
jgi:predicted DNA-binding transcriptional regulator AlpA